MPVISLPFNRRLIIIYDDNPRGRDRSFLGLLTIFLLVDSSFSSTGWRNGAGGPSFQASSSSSWLKIERRRRGGRVHGEECVRGTPARVTSGTQRSKSPWWFEKRETRKLRTFLMQKGSRSGAEVGRNNDGVPVEMIHPSNILGSRSSRGWRSNNRFALSLSTSYK